MLSNNISLLILGVATLIVLYFTLVVIAVIVKNLKSKSALKKVIKKETDRLAKFKKDGKIHKWVRLPVYSIEAKGAINTLVCEHTGYCPELDDIIPIENVKSVMIDIQVEKEFEEYKNKKVEDLRKIYGLSEQRMQELIYEIFSIKKNFHINKMEKSEKA